MENQRRTPPPPSTFDRNKDFRKSGERPSGPARYQSRDARDNRDSRDSRDNRGFQPRGDRFQRPGGFQPREDRFGKRPGGGFGPRSDRPPGRDRFAPKGKGAQPWKEVPKVKIVSELQVTDGKLQGKFLQASSSPKAAITPQKLREAMFKILFRRIRAKRFLDLCAGSGTIGIEAISRGAIVATFVERSPKMCSFIRKNMESCEIKSGHGEVVELEVMPFLKQMGKRRRFWDVVYFDAPAEKEFDEAMKYLSRGTAISPGGTLAVEHPAEVFLPERAGVLKRWRVVVQGDKAISFFERK